MRLGLRAGSASLLAGLCCSLLACGSSDAPSTAGGAGAPASAGSAGAASAAGGSGGAASGAGGGGATAGSAGSSAAGQGGAATGGAGTAGAGGALGGAGASGATGSAGAGGSGGTGPSFPDPSSFVCNAMLGVSVTGDWYNAGFETGLDGSKWQLKWRNLTFVEQWADPTNDIWSQAFTSNCANGSSTPDRVIFTGVNWTYTTEAEWETKLTAVVETLKGKYPALKEIDLMTMLRAPGNNLCGNTNVAASHEQVVAPFIDQAIAAVVAKYPSLVRAAPPFYAPDCAVFLPDSPHFADGKAAVVAKVIRDYYATH